MFPIIVNDGQTPFPDDDIYYIVCKEGVYLKKRLGVMDSVAPVKQISILNSVEATAKMHIKKIPAKNGKQIINFFKAVFKEHYAEAIVLLFYNQQTKHHITVCPKQEVSAAGADYTRGVTIAGYEMIGTIHSHASMSAFHSSTDDADEKTFDGLHITFGNMRDDDISVSASIVANGFRVIVDPRDYMNQMEMTVNIDEEEKVPYARTWKWNPKLKRMSQIETASKYYTKRVFDQRFQVRLSKDPKFDEKWMDHVEKRTYVNTAWAYTKPKDEIWSDGWYGHNSGYGDDSYWKNWRGHQNTKGKKPGYVAPAAAAAKKIAASTDEKFLKKLEALGESDKDTLMKWALKRLDADANITLSDALESDVEELSHYECVSCVQKFSFDEAEDSAVCPTCGQDDYLVEISAIEVMQGVDSNLSDEETEVHGSMIKCPKCGSSFTRDFIADGECPFCQTILIPADHPDSKIDVQAQSGDYLDPDTEAIQESIQDDVERIPIPDQVSIPINRQQRKPGLFGTLFNRRNKKL